MKVITASGKRKRAIARASLYPGTGKVRVNGTLLEVYEPIMAKMKLQEALILAGDTAYEVDIIIDVNGGGINAQVEAARLAAARALSKHSKRLEKVYLKYDRNFLVADVRRNECSKPNCRGKARAKKQKSYR
jgi:small subunit ribosomal protein S9